MAPCGKPAPWAKPDLSAMAPRACGTIPSRLSDRRAKLLAALPGRFAGRRRAALGCWQLDAACRLVARRLLLALLRLPLGRHAHHVPAGQDHGGKGDDDGPDRQRVDCGDLVRRDRLRLEADTPGRRELLV